MQAISSNTLIRSASVFLECNANKMTLLKGKHNIIEIDGRRCSLVESSLTPERFGFLKEILEHNGYTVLSKEEKDDKGTVLYTIGVTDILFNPVITVYERLLRNKRDEVILPDYWNQKSDKCDKEYWMLG